MCLRQVSILCHFCLFLSCVLDVLNSPVPSVSNPGFPEPETRVFGYFLLPETRFFQLPNPCILKILELLLHSNISDSDNTEVERLGRVTAKSALLNIQLLS